MFVYCCNHCQKELTLMGGNLPGCVGGAEGMAMVMLHGDLKGDRIKAAAWRL